MSNVTVKWERSPMGREWKAKLKQDGKTTALLNVQKHGDVYYWQTMLAGGGTPGGKVASLEAAKKAAISAAHKGRRG